MRSEVRRVTNCGKIYTHWHNYIYIGGSKNLNIRVNMTYKLPVNPIQKITESATKITY